MCTLQLKVYDLLKARFNENKAQTVIEYIEQKAEEKVNQKKDIFLTKDDKVDIMRAIYATNFIQFLATIGSMIAMCDSCAVWPCFSWWRCRCRRCSIAAW